MENRQLINDIIEEYNLINLIPDDKFKTKILEPSIKDLEEKRRIHPELNYEKILTVMLLIISKMKERGIKKSIHIITLTASIIWHSMINRPRDKDYFKAEIIAERLDSKAGSALYLRKELGIGGSGKRKFDSLENFIEVLNGAPTKGVQRERNKEELETMNIIRQIIIKKILKREKYNKSAVESAVFLYLNPNDSFTVDQIWEQIKDFDEHSGDTAKHAFNTDLSLYTDNSELQEDRKPKPSFFTITNLPNKPYERVLLDDFREKIEIYLETEPSVDRSKKDFDKKDRELDSIYKEIKLIEKIKNALLLKNQIILMGPPGTSKTFLAKQIALQLTNGNPNNIELVQFHPTYSYEDFVECKTVTGDNDQLIKFEYEPKIFRTICKDAKDIDENFVLIIDEINRGNVEKIFGELIYGIEHREEEIKTVYANENKPLVIPDNLYIIGTMNTVDLSIANIDAALRRRFYVIEMKPKPQILKNWLTLKLGEKYKQFQIDLVEFMGTLNKQIERNHLMGRYRTIGHTIFMLEAIKKKGNGEQIINNLRIEWKHTIKPTILEYLNFNREDFIIFKNEFKNFYNKCQNTLSDVELYGNP